MLAAGSVSMKRCLAIGSHWSAWTPRNRRSIRPGRQVPGLISPATRPGNGFRSTTIRGDGPVYLNDGTTLDVLRTTAEIYDQRLNKVDEAKECYRRLLSADNEDMAAFTPLEAMVWKGLTVRLSGFYELFKYSFALGDALASPPPNGSPAGDRKPDQGARHIAPGASDNFFGAIVQVGYQY